MAAYICWILTKTEPTESRSSASFSTRVINSPAGTPRVSWLLPSIMIIGAELLHLNHDEWWNRSKLVPYGETVGDWLRAMVGEKGEPWAKLERLTGVKVRPK